MGRTLPVPRPFLKWAGGKGQLLPRLLAELPSRFGDYHEPFLGGGALFFALCRQRRMSGRSIFLSDNNAELARTWKAIRDNIEGVIRTLAPLKYDKDQFAEVRAMDPATLLPTATAARMIYLNRTCFNGLYRVNRKGQFNVSFGRYDDPLICDEENLRAVSAALAGVRIEARPFALPIDGDAGGIRSGSLVYLDPPYLPVSETANFDKFTREGFGPKQHMDLAFDFDALAKAGVLVMLTASDTAWTRVHYAGRSIVAVKARRSINSKATARGVVMELIVKSYEDPQVGLAV